MHRDICIVATDKLKYLPPEEVRAGVTECAGKVCHRVKIQIIIIIIIIIVIIIINCGASII